MALFAINILTNINLYLMGLFMSLNSYKYYSILQLFTYNTYEYDPTFFKFIKRY